MPSKMKSCESYRMALTDVANTGEEPALELRAHLEICASCRASLAEEVQLFTAIDSGLRASANAEVPASLFPRVRAKLNESAAPRRSWIPVFAAISATATLLLAIVILRGAADRAAPKKVQLSAAVRGDVPRETKPAPDAMPSVEKKAPPLRAKTPWRARTAAVAPFTRVAVLVPPGQKQAMDILLASLQQGVVKPDVLLADQPEKSLPELEVSPLAIAPIEIKPLVQVGTEQASPSEKASR